MIIGNASIYANLVAIMLVLGLIALASKLKMNDRLEKRFFLVLLVVVLLMAVCYLLDEYRSQGAIPMGRVSTILLDTLMEILLAIFSFDWFLYVDYRIFRSPEHSLQNHYLEEDSDASVRHVEFTNLRAFLLTDFYEGLAHNHYPRRCPVCKRYFLMEHAYRQKYCKGYAPLELTGGKQILCADFTLPADSGFEKEAAAANEVKRMYKSSTGTLRSYAFRKKITKEAMKAAIRLAGDRRDEAIRDHDYATGRYPEEIHFKRLLSDVGVLL